MVVSSTSMKVGMTTARATIQGLIARRGTRPGGSAMLLMMPAPSPRIKRLCQNLPRQVLVVMQEAKADDAGGQGVPGFLDHRQAVVADPHPPQPLEPTDGPLDHPADLA